MKRGTWKRRERDVAFLLGGRRTGATGTNTNDVVHPTFAVEIKARGKFPKLVTDAMEQARTAKRAGGKLPLVFLIEEGSQLKDALVCARVGDVESFLENWPQDETQLAWDHHLDREVERLQDELADARVLIAKRHRAKEAA